jgi:hypothetical protein
MISVFLERNLSLIRCLGLWRNDGSWVFGISLSFDFVFYVLIMGSILVVDRRDNWKLFYWVLVVDGQKWRDDFGLLIGVGDRVWKRENRV